MDTNEAVVSFFEAVNKNDVSTVKDLLKNNQVMVDARNPFSQDSTALHIAAGKGFHGLVQVLVDEFGAPVNVKDAQGRIPLQTATDLCHKTVAQFLVLRNSELPEYAEQLLSEKMVIDPSSPADNNTVLQFFDAVMRNDINKVKEYLENKLVDVNVKHPVDNRTALHYAAGEGLENLAHFLVDEFRAEVNIKDGNGQIPLQVATDLCHMNITKFLLKRNSDLREYAECMLNEDPIIDELFDAAESNNIEKVLELVNGKKVDVNTRDKSRFGRSILHVGVINGHEELVRLLIDELNADIQLEDEIGDTPYHVSVDHPEISDFLLERGYRDPYREDGDQ